MRAALLLPVPICFPLTSSKALLNKFELTSVLRDTYLDIEEEGYHTFDKINHAHVYGGPVNLIRALNRNMDLNIDSFIRVNW